MLPSLDPEQVIDADTILPDGLLAPLEAILQRPLAELIAATLDATARSDDTRRAYQTAIGLFVQHLDQRRGDDLSADVQAAWRPFAEPTREGRRTAWVVRPPCAVLRLVDAGVLVSFRAWREQQGDSLVSASLRVSAVRAFLAVAYRDGVLTRPQAEQLDIQPYRQRQKTVVQPVGRRLTPDEVRALRGAVDTTTHKGVRDLLMLDLMLYLGLRREEAATLPLGALRQDGGRWWAVVDGKGSKPRRLKVHDVLYQSLERWLNAAELAVSDDRPVLRSFDRGDHPTHKPLDASQIGRLVAHYGYAAGIAAERGSQQLSPHDLRRTCARNAYDNGANLLLVQAMLGHDDPKTTAHYIGAWEADEDTAVDYLRY